MKKSLYGLVVISMFVMLAVAGCSSGGSAVSSGHNSVVVSKSPITPGENGCANGGISVEAGIDTNSNGILDANEVTSTQYVCNGANGTNGADGTNGTNGADGVNGANGSNGMSVGITLSVEPSGTNCPNGGTKIEVGPDANNDGTPDSVTSTDYICNGTDQTAALQPEACAGCHVSAGAGHQAVYNDYVDTTLSLTIDSVTSDGTGTTTVTFTVKKNGSPYTPTAANFNAEFDQKTAYAVQYDNSTRMFTPSKSLLTTNSANVSYLGSGQYTLTQTGLTFAPESANALVYIYVADGALATEGMTLYGDVANIGKEYGNVDAYVSTANVSGCEKCHGSPYRKHGYRMAKVDGLPDFAACKTCHYDTRSGSHQSWALLVDKTARYAELNALASACTTTLCNSVEKNMTDAEKAKYAYTANVMNDVHMSHAMEFAYPQSMANCATCHEGKLSNILTDANFTIATCRSCHPVTGVGGTDDKRAPALITLMTNTNLQYQHNNEVGRLYADASPQPVCTGCHNPTGWASNKVFSKIHTGYNSMIYADANGTRYSDVFKVSIDKASFLNSVVTVTFSATESPDIAGLAVTDITPSVYAGLYGYNSKNMIARVSGTKVSGANGTWVYTVNLSSYATRIADGSVKRVEIAVLPQLKNAAGVTLALNAPSKTFDLGTKAFVNFYSPVVKVEGCNNCHDALATTFHSANRGGNITVCKVCHIPANGGSHLEMQSRSIDSYVHAIHSFQAFDIGSIDFTDPVKKLHYEHHIESTYPNFTILNCESCHYAGTYDVPAQSKSLPGLLSSAATVTTWARNIGVVPSVVTGPGSRACGSCHRADLIKEDNAAGLEAFNQHTKTNGYMLENSSGLFDEVIDAIMSIFK